MAEQRVERKLEPIFAAHVARYSRLMGEDKTGTRAGFNAHFNEPTKPSIANPHLRKADYIEEMIAQGIVSRSMSVPLAV